ncbi:hypothetical protein I3760_01G231500 [Carya illinoinensis]|nr:hypothetical protein I3760_01G231500 [Carya illinoinensis]
MMAGNPNWWSMHPPSLLTQYALASSSLPLNPLADNQEPPQSWSQLIIGGISPGDDDRFGPSHFQNRKVENWEDQILNPSPRVPVLDVIKQEASQNSNLYSHGEEEFQAARSAWSQVMPVSSPGSYATSFSNNDIYDFTYNKMNSRNQHPDHSSESASTTTGGVHKKARVQSSSSQKPLKVRKEKLGDRITALHQLVSPFGKTDTASVLLEAIGYIRFLLGQIEALSSPYFGNTSNNLRNQQRVQGERNCVFPEDPGQLVNDACLKRKGSAANLQDSQDKPPKEDLRSRGLCLVPVSCTQHVGSDNGADYWAPAFGSGF